MSMSWTGVLWHRPVLFCGRVLPGAAEREARMVRLKFARWNEAQKAKGKPTVAYIVVVGSNSLQ